MKFPQLLPLLMLVSALCYAQTNCNPVPQVNFPGGRVIMSYDGNVHDDDDIIAMPYALAMWWAAGLKDKVVQVEYNNHVCDITAIEGDGVGAGYGDDSQNMRVSAQGAIGRFGYDPAIFYDFETQGAASTQRMAAHIEASSAANRLWILAAGPMETVYRALAAAATGHQYVTVISHSAWNENHLHCTNARDWVALKNSFQGLGVFFVGECKSGPCNQPGDLYDQNGGFNSAVSNWTWMQNSAHEYNRWLFSRNPFGTTYFDPSDAGMSYFLITGGPYNGGDKSGDHNDARNLMENPCQNNAVAVPNETPNVTITSPANNANFSVGSTISVAVTASDPDGSISAHQVMVNGAVVDNDGAIYTPHSISNLTEGSYTITVTVTDNAGATGSDTVVITAGNSGGNTNPDPEPEPTPGPDPIPGGTGEPSVAITAPLNGSAVSVGSTVPITLTAADSDGSIQLHQVYVNNILVDTDGANYTAHQITNIAQGTYAIRVKVTDNTGNTATDEVVINAGGSTPPPPPSPDPGPSAGPSLSFLTPLDGSVVSVGANVPVNLSASSPNGNIIKYQVYVNNTLVDTDGSTFTPYVIQDIPAGSHVIRATVTDFYGQKATESITITAGAGGQSAPKNPTVGFVTPANNQYFPVGSNITVSLAATDPDGTVVKYQIFVNNQLVDTDGQNFTPHVISKISQGTYIIRAVVTDNQGNTGSSEVVVYGGNAGASQVMGRSVFESGKSALPLKVAENPVKENTLKVEQDGNRYYIITNLEGEILKASKIDGNPRAISIPLGEFSSGLYLIITDKASSKFIVE